MADGGQLVRIANPTTFWGNIQASAGAHETTATLWGRLRDQIDTLNAADPSISYRFGPTILTDINSLRALAGGQVRATEALRRAAPGETLDQRFIGSQIYARPASDRGEIANYHLNITATMERFGVETTEYYKLEYSSLNLPATVGELRDDVAAWATNAADTYGATSITPVDIFVGQF